MATQAFDISTLSPDIQNQVKSGTPNVGDAFNLPNGQQITRVSNGGYMTADDKTPIVLGSNGAVKTINNSLDQLAQYTSKTPTSYQSQNLPDIGSMVQKGNTGGSNPSPIYSDKSGKQFVVKPGGNSQQVGDYIPYNPSNQQNNQSDNRQNNQQSDKTSANLIPGTSFVSSGNADIDAQVQGHQANIDTYKAEIAGINDTINSIRNSTYISPQNQAVIDQISSTYNVAIQKQEQVNAAVMAGMTQAGIRAGRSRYTPDIEASAINKTMQDGLDKVSNLQAQKAGAIAKAQLAANQSDFDNLYKQMDALQKMESDETKAATDLLKSVQDSAKQVADAQKASLDALKTKQDMFQKEAQSAAYTVFQYIQSQGDTNPDDIKKAVQEYAAANGYDPNALLNEVEKLETTKNSLYGSGTIGEYNFAKDRGGFTGTYQEFLNMKKSTSGRGTTESPENKIGSALEGAVGADGFVSPDDWKRAMNDWTKQTKKSEKSFVQTFGRYMNPDNQNYYVGG